MTRRAAFAIPGALDTVTGGYLYERRLLEGLRELGTDTLHLPLAASFPAPSETDEAAALRVLRGVSGDRPLILDGLVFGSISTAGLAELPAPIVAMIHHPLAHEEGLSPERRAHLFRTERDNLRLARAVLVPSPHTARILVGEYGADPALITIARPGTDRPRLRARPVAPPLVLSVGIQHPRKGHDVLLRALARLSDLEWSAVIAGTLWDRAYGADLLALGDDLGLSGRVRIAGDVPAGELDELWAAASVFALATRYEGYGLVFDEALARGLPVVTCRTGAVPETVPAEAGLLVPPDDPAAFADALRVALTDAGVRGRMSRAARRAGDALPSWLDTARVAQRVLDALPAPSP